MILMGRRNIFCKKVQLQLDLMAGLDYLLKKCARSALNGIL